MKKIITILLLVPFFQIKGAELDNAFVLAVQEHNSEKMEVLIQKGANPNTPIPYTWTEGDCDWSCESTALIYSVRHNYPNMVKVLLKVKYALNENIYDALFFAIQEGYPNVVQEFIKDGADINYVDEDKNTPLIRAIKHARPSAEFSPQAQRRAQCRWYQRREIIKNLLKAGADVTPANKDGRTALMEAVIQHDLNTVKDLLEVPEMTSGYFFGFGTKPINYVDKDGNTALIHAIKVVEYRYIDNQQYHICTNSQSIITALIKTPGIDPDLVNNKGETARTLLEKLKEKMNR